MHAQSETSMAQSVAMRMVFPSITVGGVQKEKYSPKRGDVISNGPQEPNKRTTDNSGAAPRRV
jgi:hypothetical protein